jgi:hypothetical protein
MTTYIMTTLKTIDITIKLTGYFYNHWPNLKIIFNNTTLFDDKISNNVVLNFKVSALLNNTLRFVHYGKKFGENNIWDSNHQEDCYIVIDDILLDQVSIGLETIHKLKFLTNWSNIQLELNDADFIKKYSVVDYSSGKMSFNGTIDVNFYTPVYDWIIDQRFKTFTTSSTYFSNFSSKWHYEKDIELINEIKNLMKLN